MDILRHYHHRSSPTAAVNAMNGATADATCATTTATPRNNAAPAVRDLAMLNCGISTDKILHHLDSTAQRLRRRRGRRRGSGGCFRSTTRAVGRLCSSCALCRCVVSVWIWLRRGCRRGRRKLPRGMMECQERRSRRRRERRKFPTMRPWRVDN